MRRRHLILTLVLAALVALGSTVALAEPQDSAGRAAPKPYRVGLIGDFPYDALQEEQAQNLFEELNGEKLTFLAHDGDIKSGSSACTEDVYQREFRRFEASRNPLVYTPGDNEWTDCHRPPNPTPRGGRPVEPPGPRPEHLLRDGRVPRQEDHSAHPPERRVPRERALETRRRYLRHPPPRRLEQQPAHHGQTPR